MMHLHLRRRDRLREGEERQREVAEGVLVSLEHLGAALLLVEELRIEHR